MWLSSNCPNVTCVFFYLYPVGLLQGLIDGSALQEFACLVQDYPTGALSLFVSLSPSLFSCSLLPSSLLPMLASNAWCPSFNLLRLASMCHHVQHSKKGCRYLGVSQHWYCSAFDTHPGGVGEFRFWHPLPRMSLNRLNVLWCFWGFSFSFGLKRESSRLLLGTIPLRNAS